MKKSELINEIERLRDEVTNLRQSSLKRDNLYQRNSLLASMVESSESAILGVSVSGLIVSWNKAAARMFGYSSDEAFGRHVSTLAPPDRRQESQSLREKVLSGQPVPNFHTVRLRKNGTVFPAIVSLSPIINRKRQIVGMSEIMQDTTVLKDMKAALLRAELKYRSIFENAVEGVFQTTGDGRPLMANPACLRMLGYSSEKEFMTEVSDIGAQLYAEPGDRERFERLVEEYGMVDNFEVRVTRKDKTHIWVSLSARAVKDTRGRTVFYEGTVEDITKRKLAEKNLILEKRISDSIIESLPGIFYLFDAELNYVRWNMNLEGVSGYSSEELSRMKPFDFFRGEGRERVEERIRECFEGNEVTVEAELILKDGSPVPYVFTGKRIVLDDKIHLLGGGLDISSRKRT
jgi:PAS domain S-box-containing protein